MKINRKDIMRNAWNIRRADGVSMSIALKAAWAIAKAEIAAEDHLTDYCGHAKVVTNKWRKGGHARTYIEVRHYTNAWKRKRTTQIGYVDHTTGRFVAA